MKKVFLIISASPVVIFLAVTCFTFLAALVLFLSCVWVLSKMFYISEDCFENNGSAVIEYGNYTVTIDGDFLVPEGDEILS